MALHVLVAISASTSSFPAQAQGQEHTNIAAPRPGVQVGR